MISLRDMYLELAASDLGALVVAFLCLRSFAARGGVNRSLPFWAPATLPPPIAHGEQRCFCAVSRSAMRVLRLAVSVLRPPQGHPPAVLEIRQVNLHGARTRAGGGELAQHRRANPVAREPSARNDAEGARPPAPFRPPQAGMMLTKQRHPRWLRTAISARFQRFSSAVDNFEQGSWRPKPLEVAYSGGCVVDLPLESRCILPRSDIL
jgi:hypothetical protein